MASHFSHNRTLRDKDHFHEEVSLSLRDILPLRPKMYDKNRAPKFQGQPTIVYFHVTVLSLDSINEESMVSITSSLISVVQNTENFRHMSRIYSWHKVGEIQG